MRHLKYPKVIATYWWYWSKFGSIKELEGPKTVHSVKETTWSIITEWLRPQYISQQYTMRQCTEV